MLETDKSAPMRFVEHSLDWLGGVFLVAVVAGFAGAWIAALLYVI